MGGCCCCFPSKPPRENPMHPAAEAEALLQQKPNHTPPRHQPPPAITKTDKSQDPVMRLKTGFQRFKTNLFDKHPKLFEPLKKDQSPKAGLEECGKIATPHIISSFGTSLFWPWYMVFACADSRVCPTLTLGLHPGEAFTVRNVAGMVPAYQETRHCSIGSAIEFAVVVLKVEYIVVIGHSCCGGIRELLSLNDEGPNAYHFIEDWVKIGLDAKKKVQRENRLLPFDDQCTVLEKEAVNVSLRNLKSYPFVKDRTWKGTLHLIGARYDFVQGSFETWEP